MSLNWNFQRGGGQGLNPKKPSTGGVNGYFLEQHITLLFKCIHNTIRCRSSDGMCYSVQKGETPLLPAECFSLGSEPYANPDPSVPAATLPLSNQWVLW